MFYVVHRVDKILRHCFPRLNILLIRETNVSVPVLKKKVTNVKSRRNVCENFMFLFITLSIPCNGQADGSLFIMGKKKHGENSTFDDTFNNYLYTLICNFCLSHLERLFI